ncbi:MAG: alanine:cation symporter family protein [Bacteroidales bacterium]|nr:alanine:cation symporter family protein [Bacteroidales bacterium]
MQSVSSIIESISSAVWGWPMIILLLGTHIFMTIRLRFPQLQVGKAVRLSVTKDHHSHGDVSQFGALATALAATIGTGNIVGVATAVSLGGPGAVLWCWITGVFGMATKYSEGLLAVKYRVKTKDGRMLGGPMFALERGLHAKWLAILFALLTAIAAFGIGNTVQANSISMLLNETYGVSQTAVGLILALMVLLVIVFGVKGISRVCSALVPFMAVFYVLGCLVILGMNWPYLGESIRLICRSAFTARAAGGGFVGSTVLLACRFGIARGLFSNESGLGSAPIVAAAAQTRNPVRQALVSSTGTFWDTVVVCAITGLVLVSSIVAHPDIDCTQGAALTKAAFEKIPYVGPAILSVGIVTFAFSTILGWSYYGERAVEYLAGRKLRTARIITGIYRALFVVAVFLGSVMSLSVVWNLADIANAMMAIPNLVAILLLSGVIARETKYYLWENRLEETCDEEPPTLQ